MKTKLIITESQFNRLKEDDSYIQYEVKLRIGEIKNNIEQYQKFFENLTNKNYKIGGDSDRDLYQNISAELYSALLYINDLKVLNNKSEIGEDRVNTGGYIPPKERQARTNPITGYDIDSDEFGSTNDNPTTNDYTYIKPDAHAFRAKQNRTWIDTRN